MAPGVFFRLPPPRPAPRIGALRVERSPPGVTIDDRPARKLFDAHFHVIDPRFPLVENQGYLPRFFTAADYLARVAPLGVVGGAVVSGSFQEFDRAYLRDALERLGPRFVGVVQLPPEGTTDAEILDLDRVGVRGVRLNLVRRGHGGLDHLEAFAKHVHALVGWHVEFYAEVSALGDLAARILRLPAASVAHLGGSREGLPILLRLAGAGVRVKASGFGRGDHDVPETLRALAAENPDCLLFGTDLPSTRVSRPFRDEDVALVESALTPEQARRAFYDNAVAFYRPREHAGIGRH